MKALRLISNGGGLGYDDSTSPLSSMVSVNVRAMLPIHLTLHHDNVRILEKNLHAFLTSGQMEVSC
jgi:hypothetical protein